MVTLQKCTNKNQNQCFVRGSHKTILPNELNETSNWPPLVKSSQNSPQDKNCNIGIPDQLSEAKKHCSSNHTNINKKLSNLLVKNGGSIVLTKLPVSNDKLNNFQNCLSTEHKSNPLPIMDISKSKSVGGYSDNFNKIPNINCDVAKHKSETNQTNKNKRIIQFFVENGEFSVSDKIPISTDELNHFQSCFPIELKSNLVSKVDINKPIKVGGYSGQNNFNKRPTINETMNRYENESKSHLSNTKLKENSMTIPVRPMPEGRPLVINTCSVPMDKFNDFQNCLPIEHKSKLMTKVDINKPIKVGGYSGQNNINKRPTINETMNRYKNETKSHLSNTKLTENSMTIPVRPMPEGRPLVINTCSVPMDKFNDFQNCLPIEHKSKLMTKVDINKPIKVGGYSGQNNFNKRPTINETMNRYENESKSHLSNTKLTENSMTIPVRPMPEGRPLVINTCSVPMDKFNDFQNCLPIEHKSKLMTKVDINKSTKVGGYSGPNLFNERSGLNTTMNSYKNESKNHFSNTKLTENSMTIPVRPMPEGRPLVINTCSVPMDKFNDFQNCLPIEHKSKLMTKVDINKPIKVGGYSGQNNFNKRPTINETMNRYENESKSHLSNTKLTENSMTIPVRPMPEGRPLVINTCSVPMDKFNDFQNCLPIEHKSKLMTKVDINKSTKVGGYSGPNLFNERSGLNTTMNSYKNESKNHFSNTKLTENSTVIPVRPIVIDKVPVCSDKLNNFQNNFPIKHLRNPIDIAVNNKLKEVCGYSGQNNFSKRPSIKGTVTRLPGDESTNHHSNTNQIENSKIALTNQITEDGLLSIKQKDKPKKQSGSNLVPKIDVNKSYEIGSFSKKIVQFNKISSAKSDGTQYNNRQNFIKKRVSTLRETEDGCIIIDDLSDSSEEMKNVINVFSIEPKDKLKKQDNNTIKKYHSKSNLMQQLGVNYSNSTGDLLEKNKPNKMENYNLKKIPMTQIAVNRFVNFIGSSEFNKIPNQKKKTIPATYGRNMKLKDPTMGNSETKGVTTMSSSVNSVSNLSINSNLIKKNLPKGNEYMSLEQDFNNQNSPIIVLDDSSDSVENSNNEKSLQLKYNSINVTIKRRCNTKQSFCCVKNSELQLAAGGFSGPNKANEELSSFQKTPPIGHENESVSEKWQYDSQKNKFNKETAILKETGFNKLVMKDSPSKLIDKLTNVKENPTSIEKGIQIKKKVVLKNQKEIVPEECVENNLLSRKVSGKSITQVVFQAKAFEKPVIKKSIERSCKICGVLITSNDWTAHTQKYHLDIFFQKTCNLCGKKNQSNIFSSMYHGKLHWLYECFPCEQCNKQFYDRTLLVEHMRKDHKFFLPFECQRCKKLFKKRKCFRMHNCYDCYNLSLQPKCIECNITFQGHKNLEKNMKKVHNKKIELYCQYCDAHYKSRKSLMIHFKARHGKNGLKCTNYSDVSIVKNPNKWIDNPNESFVNLSDSSEIIDQFIETKYEDIDMAIGYDDDLIKRFGKPNECVNSNGLIGDPDKSVKISKGRVDIPNDYTYGKNEWLKKLIKFADESDNNDSGNKDEYKETKKCTKKPNEFSDNCNVKQMSIIKKTVGKHSNEYVKNQNKCVEKPNETVADPKYSIEGYDEFIETVYEDTDVAIEYDDDSSKHVHIPKESFVNLNNSTEIFDQFIETRYKDIDMAIGYDDDLIKRFDKSNEYVDNRNGFIDDPDKYVDISNERVDTPNDYVSSKNECYKKKSTINVNKLLDKCNALNTYNVISDWQNEVQITRRLHRKMFGTFPGWLEDSHGSINKMHVPVDICDKMLNADVSPQNNIFELPKFQRVLKCSLCYKKFPTRLLFHKHIATYHETRKPYTCKYCDKKFYMKSKFKVHQKFHIMTKKQFVCTFCTKSFFTAVNFKKHICMKKKTLECEVCHLFFVRPCEFKTHQDVHKRDNTYICEFCPEVLYLCVADLREHIKLNHGFPALDWSRF